MNISPRRRGFFVALLVFVPGLIIFVLIGQHPVAPLQEVPRRDLELRDGIWYAPGQTNGFTGFLLDTYDDGARKSRSSVSNGWLEGLSVGWHTNGQQQVEEHFVAGTSQGLRTKWYPDGQKQSEVNIVGGKLQGTFRSWHENGQLAEEVELKNGRPDGLSKAYYPSGCLKARVVLQDGKPVAQQFWQDGEYKETATPNSKPTSAWNAAEFYQRATQTVVGRSFSGGRQSNRCEEWRARGVQAA